MCSFTRRSSQQLLAIVLMAALLCAQWAGLSHRVAHADGKAAWSALKSQTDSESGKDAGHSCSLFDAAALGTGIHTAPFALALLGNVRVLASWTAFVSWNVPFTCHFSSRAPPRG